MILKKRVLFCFSYVFYCFLQFSRTIDEHVPLSRAPPSSAVSTEAENRNLVSNLYTSPPIPLVFSPRNLHTPPKLPLTQSNTSEGARGITHALPEKETWPVGDLSDLDVKKKDRETIEECPICLEGIFCLSFKVTY